MHPLLSVTEMTAYEYAAESVVAEIDGDIMNVEEAALTDITESLKVLPLRYVSLQVMFHDGEVLPDIVTLTGLDVPLQTVSLAGKMTLTGRGLIVILTTLEESTQQFESPE